MCSTHDDNNDIEDLMVAHDCKTRTKVTQLTSNPESVGDRTCRKCGEAAIGLQRQDPMCRACFMVYCDHKFRSTIGKSKKIRPGDNVLIAYSGGLCSSAMLFMVEKTLEAACNKRLHFSPALLHINEFFLTHDEQEEKKEMDELFHKMKESKFPVYLSSLEMALCDNDDKDSYWDTCLPEQKYGNEELRQELVQLLNNTSSLSTKEDYLKLLRIRLITDIAKCAGFSCVFFGASCNSLSVQLLSDIALGRGSQISADTSFYDRRYEVPICRPLREFLLKELELYAQENGILYKIYPTYSSLISMSDARSKSLQSLTEKFVSNLQNDFPSTVHTIFRTAGKIAPSSSERSVKEICIFCQSKLDNMNPDPCSALELLSISSEFSQPSLQNGLKNTNSSLEVNDLQYLCSGCQITAKEMGLNKSLHSQLFTKPNSQTSREKSKDEVKCS